MLTRKLPA